MSIDFSKINLSILPKRGNVVKAPSRVKKAPLGGRIDYGAVKLSNIYTPARVAPKPAAISKNAGKGAPITFQGRPLVTPVEQQRMKAVKPTPTAVSRLTGKTVEQRTLEGKQMTSAFAGKSFFDGFKESVDSYNNAQAKSILGQNAPAAGGITGNRWVDLGASLATMGAVVKTGVQVVGGLVSAINFTRAMNSKWNWPTVEGGVASNDLAVRVAQANPNVDKGTASSIASLVARTGGNSAQLNALARSTSTLSQSLNQISNAARNPSTALNIIPSATRVIAQTGIFQAIPMPSGLVHSTSPAIPMGGKTQPVVQAPIEEPRVATEPYVSRDKFQVEHPLLERPQPAVPGVKTTKSMDTIMAEEEAAGRKLETTPRAVDKTIPALDIKKANLVDVTAKVDLKSVQVKYPKTDTVVLDTKRRVVMFMHGTTPLEAIAVDKPQLKEWYGIEGTKLLGEVTRPVVAQIAPTAPTLSKMETPEAIDVAARKVADAAQLKSPAYIRNKKITDDMAKRGLMRGSSLTGNPDLKEATQVWQNAYDGEVNRLMSVPSLSTTPQKGPSAAISNQKTGISTSTPVPPRGGTDTGAEAVKWGKWKKAGTAEYQLVNELTQIRQWGKTDFQPPTFGKPLQFKGDTHSYFLVRESAVPAKGGFSALPASYHVVEAKSGNAVSIEATEAEAVATARRALDGYGQTTDDRITELVALHGGEANPASVPTALITSTSAPAAAPSLGNATPAHGLVDYSRIELNGTTSQTSPKVLASVSNTGKRSRVETEGFNNYIQNTAGTKDTSLSPFAKFKEGRDLQVRRYENEFDGLMKTPAGAEWMTLAIEADEVLREEYTRPFSINEAGERVYAEGEFAPAILNRYLKQYGPNFGKFLQHLQRAGISTETTLGLSAEKEALKQKHIFDARMSLVNFQKNEPQLFTAYMSAADELGNANALLAEFYKGMISPETYANDKANPHYYVSLSAGKTDVFDRSGVAPLERTHGLTDLENVVPPLEGLKAVYVDAIRAQGINNAKKEAVKSNPNSEVATTELSDSIVHLQEDGKDRAYDVHDTNVTESVHNLTLKKPEVPTWEKHLVKAPTTALRLFATGLNPAFGLYNIMRDMIQSIGTVPFDPTGLVKGTIRAFKSPQLSQWFDSYRDPMMSKGARATEAIKKILEIVTFPNEIGEGLIRSITAETIIHRGGTYLDQLHGYYASTGFFALHGTFFNDFIASCIPFTRATIAVVRSAYRNTFFGLPIGGKGGTFSGKQGAEKLAGRNLATIIFTIISALAVKEAGKEKEYKLLRDRASYFYFPTPSGAWVKLPVPIGFVPIKGVVDSLFGYKSDPLGVAGQTLNILPGLEAFMLPPALALFLQYKFNINFFTGAAITAAVGTPAANPLEAALMKTGMDEGQAAFLVRAFLADIPSQVQYVFDMVGQGSSTQAFPASKRFIVKDPTTSSNAAVDDFYALVDAAARSDNPTLKHYVNARAVNIGKLLHNAKLYPADARVYITTATDNIIATFATIAENPRDYGIKKFGPFSWRPSGNYEELAP